jgi:hypothetical protein
MNLRALTVGLLVGGLALTGAGPALATPDDQPAVSLIVGLRAATDVVGTLERSVDVLDSEPLTGAVAVDVPADQVTEAADALRADPAVAYVEPDRVARIATNDPAFADSGAWPRPVSPPPGRPPTGPARSLSPWSTPV